MTSNGFQVDTSPPLVSTVPGLQPGAGTLDSVGLVSRDMIGVHWSLADTESHVGAQYLSLYSHLYGEFQATPVQVNHRVHLSGLITVSVLSIPISVGNFRTPVQVKCLSLFLEFKAAPVQVNHSVYLSMGNSWQHLSG